MDSSSTSLTPKTDQQNPQSPVSPAPISQTVLNETKPKMRGQITVNKAFIIIYILVLAAILIAPEFFHDKAGNTLDQLGFLFNGGFLLIVLAVSLHLFFIWREMKKKS